MRKPLAVVILAAGALLASNIALFAHHSPQGEFDLFTTKSITGTFNKLEWTNPHPYLHLLVKDAKTGEEIRWDFETDGIQNVKKKGFDRTFLKWGDTLSIEYFPSRDGTHHGYIKKLTLPDGRIYELFYTKDIETAEGKKPQ